MINKMLYLLMLISLTSCKKENSVKMFTLTSTLDDEEIRGYSLKDFFSSNTDFNIRVKVISESKTLINELDRIKEKIETKGAIDGDGMGIYYNAFIFGKDTLYSNSDFKSWKYKNKILYINNSLVMSQINR